MKRKYLINLNDPDDCIGKYEDKDHNANFVKERMDLLIEMLDHDGTHEVTRSVFYEGNEAGCHMAKWGFETMFIGDGELEVTVRGRRCRSTKGDILHFGTFNAHGMKWLKDTPWIGFFHKMNICQPTIDKMLLNENCPEMSDAERAAAFSESYDLYDLAKPVVVDVPKSEIYEIRPPEFAFATFTYDGLIMKQKVGRWETDGMYEIWDFIMEDGFMAGGARPDPKPCVYYVTEGEVLFTVFKDEFIAPKDSLVHIPPYGIHSFQSIGKSSMYSVMGGVWYHDLISEWKSYEAYEPEKLKDKAFVDSLKKKYNCYLTQWGCV